MPPHNDRKILKRFANLDIDGAVRPPRPAPKDAPAARPEPGRRGPALPQRNMAPPGDDRPSPATSRGMGPMATPALADRPTAPQQESSGASGRAMSVEALRLDLRGGQVTSFRPLEVPPGATPGVITVEFTPAPRAQQNAPRATWRAPQPDLTGLDALPQRYAPPESATRRSYSDRPTQPTRAEAAPIELTELAARQVRLMAWHHGVAGAGLRILTSGPGGPDHCEFAFETEPEDGDVVFESQGVRVIVDRASLRTLRGMRVTYQDLPGATGFGVGWR